MLKLRLKTILITGGSGFLGSYLVKKFLDYGFVVVVITRQKLKTKRLNDMKNSRLHIIDFDSLKNLFQDIKIIDVVLHTATNYGSQNEKTSDIVEANLTFPLKVMEVAINYGTETFINTDTILSPKFNRYALSKYQFKQWGKELYKDNKIKFINCKLQNIYGEGNNITNFTSYIVNYCIHNKPEIRLTKGDQKRDFIYIDDVVDAYFVIVNSIDSINYGFSEFDIGSGCAVTIREFVETVKEITKSNVKLKFGALPLRRGELMFSEANTDHIKSFGWSQCYSLRDGIIRTVGRS